MDQVECVVIGAGVVGLAVARALALQGREVIIVERNGAIGEETSSRHSEVIHAGIYYPEGSLKARFCVEGKQKPYNYLQSHGVAHQRLGKLIVATSEDQIAALEQIRTRAAANGVDDMLFLSGNEVTALEPELRCVTALISPSTGILDSHGYMLALQGDAEEHGAMIAFDTVFQGGAVEDDGIVLEFGGSAPMTLKAQMVINSAGLSAQPVAASLQGFPTKKVPAHHYCKGNYYALAGARAPFQRLIYPAPEAAGLGVHLTLDLGGQARFGPDVEWIDGIDYDVDPGRADSFYAAVRKYWPGLPDDSLIPAYAGIRPKIQAPGEAAVDFMVQGPADHGVAGLVNLFGIESPGVTSSLAIADHVAEHLG